MSAWLKDIKNNPKAHLIIVVVIFALAMGAATYYELVRTENETAKHHQALILNAKQAQDINTLRNELDINKQNAEMLANFVKAVQAGKIQPIANSSVQASTVEYAAAIIADKINIKDPALPVEALEDTDNTIVSPVELTPAQQEAAKQTNANNNKDTTKINEQFGVAVYKNNNYRNWEWSIGYGIQNDDKYIPIGLQRNYSKDRAIEAEIHIDPGEIKRITGGELKYVIKTDKLFGLF